MIEIFLVLAILAFTAILFLSNAVRVDIAAVSVLVAIGIFKLLPPEQLFSGFSSEAVISLIAIMIISAGLESTGVSVKIARMILRLGGDSNRRILFLLMLCSSLLASFMRSVGTVALFIPIVNRIHNRTGIAKGTLLMPMGFAAILGGSLTMVGSGSLIVLNSLLRNSYRYGSYSRILHFAPFKLFSVLPIGLALVALGMLYMLLVSPKLKDKTKKTSSSGSTKSHFRKHYAKECEIFELKVSTNSSIVNGTVKDLELKLDPTMSLICLQQDKELHYPPLRGTVIKANAIIALMASKDDITEFAEQHGLKLAAKLNEFSEILHPTRSGLSEAVIPPSSQFVGQEVRELHMKRNHNLHVLALCRGGTVYRGTELNNLVLRSGDTLGMYSTWDALHDFRVTPDFYVLTTNYAREKTYPKRIPYAVFFFALAVCLVVFANFSISVGLLLGAVGMIASGVLSVDQAYEKVSWKSVFLLAGLIPLGLVMQTSGTADWLASYLIPEEIKISAWIVQSALAVAATLLSLVLSNVGATVLLVPIAMDIAFNIGADPRLFALTVSLASANGFFAQSNQVNSLISGPGGYSNKQLIYIGGGLTLIYWIVMLVGLQLMAVKH